MERERERERACVLLISARDCNNIFVVNASPGSRGQGPGRRRARTEEECRSVSTFDKTRLCLLSSSSSSSSDDDDDDDDRRKVLFTTSWKQLLRLQMC